MPGVTQRHLGLTRGGTSGPGGQLARLPPGRAHRVPGAHRPHLQVCLLPPPSSLSKNTSSAPVLAFLLFLEAIFDLSLQPTI